MFRLKMVFAVIYILSFLTLEARTIKSYTDTDYAPGYKINIDIAISDKDGIEEARVYFGNKKNISYNDVFAVMLCKGKFCRGVLPMPKKDTENIYYKIVYKNKIGDIYDSKEYVMYKKNLLMLQPNQTKDTSHMILYSELKNPPKKIDGFKGSYSIKSIAPKRSKGGKKRTK